MSVNNQADDNISCFICEKDLECDSEDKVIFVKRGIDILNEISLERKNQGHKMNDIILYDAKILYDT